jgi:hypothetical protein
VPLLDEDYLILSTIHSAKGQEWKSVYVLNVVDGCMPSDLGAGTSAGLEEERRLIYVAMTRAKDDLNLVIPQRFFTHVSVRKATGRSTRPRTRFIPEKLLGLFECTNWPLASPGLAARGPVKACGSTSELACEACGARPLPRSTCRHVCRANCSAAQVATPGYAAAVRLRAMNSVLGMTHCNRNPCPLACRRSSQE